MKASTAIIGVLYLGLETVRASGPACYWKSRLTGSTLYPQLPGGDVTHIDGVAVYCKLVTSNPIRRGLKVKEVIAVESS